MEQSRLTWELTLLDVLRQIFLRGPRREVLEVLAGGLGAAGPEGEEWDALQQISRAAAGVLQAPPGGEEELMAEFTRLFIGPAEPPALPYASFYLSPSHTLMTSETLDVRARYLEAGVVVEQLNRIPDDHVGIELEFLYVLTSRALKSFLAGEVEAADAALAARSSFLEQHFARWAPELAERVRKATAEPLLQGAAHLLAFAASWGR